MKWKFYRRKPQQHRIEETFLQSRMSVANRYQSMTLLNEKSGLQVNRSKVSTRARIWNSSSLETKPTKAKNDTESRGYHSVHVALLAQDNLNTNRIQIFRLEKWFESSEYVRYFAWNIDSFVRIRRVCQNRKSRILSHLHDSAKGGSRVLHQFFHIEIHFCD